MDRSGMYKEVSAVADDPKGRRAGPPANRKDPPPTMQGPPKMTLEGDPPGTTEGPPRVRTPTAPPYDLQQNAPGEGGNASDCSVWSAVSQQSRRSVTPLEYGTGGGVMRLPSRVKKKTRGAGEQRTVRPASKMTDSENERPRSSLSQRIEEDGAHMDTYDEFITPRTTIKWDQHIREARPARETKNRFIPLQQQDEKNKEKEGLPQQEPCQPKLSQKKNIETGYCPLLIMQAHNTALSCISKIAKIIENAERRWPRAPGSSIHIR